MTTQPDDDELSIEESLDIFQGEWDIKRNNVYVWDYSRQEFARPYSWSGLKCPTPCDPSCEANCHERHVPQHKRDHEIGRCLDEEYYPARFRELVERFCESENGGH